ncbi:MAG: adenosine deaminase [Omnitrophica WOR_2 bacterium]
MNDLLHEYARRMPKVELHVHLEGSIRPELLLELACRNKISLPVNSLDEVKDFYQFKNFNHFIDVYFTVTSCLHTPEDYTDIAYQYGRECSRQNIRYSEPTFTMTTNVMYSGLSWKEIIHALNAGRDKAKREFGVDWGWIIDINRNRPETQGEVLDMVRSGREDGILALGLGGDEIGFPPELFTQTFETAWQENIHRVPHSGETAGPASIWTSINQLHAERIGHGVRCIEDPHLVDVIRINQIPLEICPTSNICLGIYTSYEQHPIRKLWDAGLLVTVNSDDPPMFCTDLNHEYEILVDHYGFNVDDLETASLNALRASFLPGQEKARIESEFIHEFCRLREELSL